MAEKESKSKKRGRKGKYAEWLEPDKLILIEGWARRGLTEEQIAHNMGIAAKTLCEWKKTFTPICNALKKGKEVVDLEVEGALYKRAMGYTTEEIVYENGIEVKRVAKEVPPDTTAQIFWLKNRRPDLWRDKQDLAVEGVKQVVFEGEGEMLE